MRHSHLWLVLLTLAIAALALWVDYRQLRSRKLKIAYYVLYAGTLLLALALIVYPLLPGPNQFNRLVFAPLADWLLPPKNP